jgi:hypothetical protein
MGSRTSFHKDWFRHSDFISGDAYADIQIYRHREQGDFIRLLLFLQNKENRLITDIQFFFTVRGAEQM